MTTEPEVRVTEPVLHWDVKHVFYYPEYWEQSEAFALLQDGWEPFAAHYLQGTRAHYLYLRKQVPAGTELRA